MLAAAGDPSVPFCSETRAVAAFCTHWSEKVEPYRIFTESVEEINSDNFIPRINSGFTSHILFHVLYKDINNGKNYKKISVLEAQAYLQKLVSSDVTK